MPVLSGSMSTMGYFAQGELPSDFKQTYIDAMRKYRFKDIDPVSDRDQAEGWVTLEDPFDTEFDLNKVFFTDYVVMSLRIDRIRIPAAVFKLHLQKALADYRTDKGKEKLSKDEKDEVRDFLESQLRRRVLPSVQTIDAAWNLENNRVWLFSHNKGINEIFQQLFHDTFGFTLTPKNPYVQLLHSDLEDEARDLALNIESAVFAVPSDR
jgi:recombination associated protein RdgC